VESESSSVSLGKKSVFWAAADIGGNLLVTFGAMLLMARLMTPEEFGTGALVLGTVQALNLFVGGLFHDALIQNPDSDDHLFETALSLVLLISSGVVGVSLVAAIGYHQTAFAAIGWLFVGASVSLPFSGALGIGNARMRRDFNFQSVARASLFGRLVSCGAGVGLASLGLGAWSLVAQYTIGVMVQTIFLYLRSRWRPQPRRSFGTLWPICRFALPYAFMHSLVALRIQGFLMLVTGFMGLAATGYVNVAFRVTTTPQIVLADAFTNLGLPLLSRHQHSRINMQQAFASFTQLVLSITIPTFVGLAFSANEVVPSVLGAQWTPVVPLVQLLALGAAVAFLRFPASTALRALGYVRYSFASSAFQLVFTLFGMLVLRPDDLRTTVWLWILPTFLQLPLTILVVRRVSSIGFRVVLNNVFPVLLASMTMAVVVVLVDSALQAQTPLCRLTGEVVSGGLTAVGTLLLANFCSWEAIAAVLRKA
jgi:O-antigen/teichoic acid export membrane protein